MLRDEILKIIGHGQEPERAELMLENICETFRKSFKEAIKSGYCTICNQGVDLSCPFTNDDNIECLLP